jgi:hypothetical protein
MVVVAHLRQSSVKIEPASMLLASILNHTLGFTNFVIVALLAYCPNFVAEASSAIEVKAMDSELHFEAKERFLE